MEKSISSVNFDAIARQSGAVDAFDAFGNADQTLSERVLALIQMAVDIAYQKNGTGEDACKCLATEIRESEFAMNTALAGVYSKTTWSNYAQGAQRALHFNVPFTAGLFKDAEKVLPWSKKAPSEGAKQKAGGKVQSTTQADLIKTISKALAQARLLNMTDFAGEVLDVCIDRIEGFKETE